MLQVYYLAPWRICIEGGPKDPPKNYTVQKVCISYLALSMKIFKVSPENIQIGEYFEWWPGFTKPNLPALPVI